ncbi:MAG: PAS domain-containing protein [Tagaea sp.]|nr:PAS domain-containing protein [Tagaea sp.]
MFDDASLPPEHRRFVSYWDAKRGAHAVPARRDVDPLIDLRDLAPYLGIMRPEGARIFYAVLGAGIEEAHGPRTGVYLDEARTPPFLDYLRAMFALCAGRKAPVLTRHGFEYSGGRIGRTVRVIVPLSDDGVSVDAFLGLQISRDESGAILPPAWNRTPTFSDALLSEMAWRDATGAWHEIDWRSLQT